VFKGLRAIVGEMVGYWRPAAATGLLAVLQVAPVFALDAVVDDDLVEGNTVPGRNVPPVKGCTVTGMSYAPLNPKGTMEDHTMTSSWDWCQYQCQSSVVINNDGKAVPCAHFAWYPDGQCFLQDDNVTLTTDKWCNSTHPCTENNFQVVSGPANCSVTSLWVYPPTPGEGPPQTTTTIPPTTLPALPAHIATLPPLPTLPPMPQIVTPAPLTTAPTVTITTTSTIPAASTAVGHPLLLTPVPPALPSASKDLPGFGEAPDAPSPSPSEGSETHSTGKSPIFFASIFILAFAVGGFVAYRKGLCGDRGRPCEFEDDEESDEESGHRVAE